MNSVGPWSERWEFVDPLGGGGQGDTAIVEDRKNPSLKAVIKCLREDKALDTKARRRMYKEVSHLKVLHAAGANVPEVLDDNVGRIEGEEPLFFVMSLIQGKTLSDVIKEGSLKVEVAVDVALKLCETLRFAFAEKIVHRDIKPENIIVRSVSPVDVVMVDFGISRHESDSANVTEVGEAFDNKFISLPERRGPEENKRDPRSDLTGICAIFLYCLTKCVPRDLRDSSDRPPHRWNNYSLDKVSSNDIQLTLLNTFFDRAFRWELQARFQTLDEIVIRLGEIRNPPTTIPEEDLAIVAARESILLRKSDRVSQLAEFRQPVHLLQQRWAQQIGLIGAKLTGSQFYVHAANHLPDLRAGKFGDEFGAVFLQMGVNHHNNNVRLIGYHFCSIGNECAIIRQVDCPIFQGVTVSFSPVEAPTIVARYSGDGAPPVDLLLKDCESAVARLTSHLREEIERKTKKKV